MKNSICYLIIATCFAIIILLSLRQRQIELRENPKEHDARRGTAMDIGFDASSPDRRDTIRTKSRNRTNHPQPTTEETTQLVRATIIPMLDFPADQPLPERIARVNELIQKAGVESTRLRIILRSADPAIQWRFGELSMREVPLGIALKYLCDSTKLRYHIRENGIVELTSIREEEFLPDLPNLPEIKKPSPSGETDAFGNDPNTPAETDPIDLPIPFAEF